MSPETQRIAIAEACGFKITRIEHDGDGKLHYMAAFDAYRAFHNARLETLNAFVAKRMKRMIRQGFNNSGPVQWECIYKGLTELPEFSEQSVWEAAWNACLENASADLPPNG